MRRTWHDRELKKLVSFLRLRVLNSLPNGNAIAVLVGGNLHCCARSPSLLVDLHSFYKRCIPWQATERCLHTNTHALDIHVRSSGSNDEDFICAAKSGQKVVAVQVYTRGDFCSTIRFALV